MVNINSNLYLRRTYLQTNEGGKFLKKQWRRVVGGTVLQNNFVFINWVDNVNNISERLYSNDSLKPNPQMQNQ